MPKVTLNFNDVLDAEVYLQAPEMASLLFDFENWLRTETKYSDHTGAYLEALEKVKETWYQLKSEHQPVLGFNT